MIEVGSGKCTGSPIASQEKQVLVSRKGLFNALFLLSLSSGVAVILWVRTVDA